LPKSKSTFAKVGPLNGTILGSILNLTFAKIVKSPDLLILVSSEHVPPVNVQIHMKVVLKNTVLRNTEYAGI
jgi:hypothetical protein